jgi:hypothetical protein
VKVKAKANAKAKAKANLNANVKAKAKARARAKAEAKAKAKAKSPYSARSAPCNVQNHGVLRGMVFLDSWLEALRNYTSVEFIG